MDPNAIRPSSPIDDDEWDADGFVIPSLAVGQADLVKPDTPALSNLQHSASKQTAKEEKKIYLGPHGARPHSKQQELDAIGRKQRLKYKLKDAEKKFSGVGRDNKVESLRELVGGKVSATMPKGSPRDWLDPHCHESQFEKSH